LSAFFFENATKVGDEMIKRAFRESKDMGRLETKNNRHLIAFLRYKCPAYAGFVQQPVRIDRKTTWEQFFELMSYTEGDDSLFVLQPKEGDPFLAIMGLVRDFAVNAV
jgi:hypothetical protein